MRWIGQRINMALSDGPDLFSLAWKGPAEWDRERGERGKGSEGKGRAGEGRGGKEGRGKWAMKGGRKGGREFFAIILRFNLAKSNINLYHSSNTVSHNL